LTAADAKRCTVCKALVEAIDRVPIFLEYCGGAAKPEVIERCSLLPLLYDGTPADWRRHVFSKYDYAMLETRLLLDQPIRDCRLRMRAGGRYRRHPPEEPPQFIVKSANMNCNRTRELALCA
jgi:hypothetical protein